MRLIDKIKTYRKTRHYWAIPLLILGLTGLILPIIPGIILIVYSLDVLFPKLKRKTAKTATTENGYR